MDEVSKAFVNPSWWILTIIVGLLLNIVASLIFSPIQYFLDRIFEKYRLLNQEKSAAYERKINDLKSKENILSILRLDSIYFYIKAIAQGLIFIMLSEVSYSLNIFVIPSLGVLFFIIVVRNMYLARYNSLLYSDVRKALDLYS